MKDLTVITLNFKIKTMHFFNPSRLYVKVASVIPKRRFQRAKLLQFTLRSNVRFSKQY